jgi:23S rRNA pseudouridine1911/1915/1917 synthase
MTPNSGFEYRRRVGPADAGLTVIEYLVQRYPAFPRDEWLARVGSGRVTVNAGPANHRTSLRAGDTVSWMRPPWQEPDAPASFAILHRRDGLLAVAKPSGLPTVPGGGMFLDRTLLSLVRRRFPGASPLHRLGRATSGIVLFATTQQSASQLSREWREREVVKVYRALVAGTPGRDAWRVDTRIGPVPHAILKTVHAASEQGKAALSEVNVLERRKACAVVHVRISTGRPHQIRIHLAASGHPLVGDPLYVAGGVPAAGSRALPGDSGYFLHAESLRFRQPVTGEWIDIYCLPPPILRCP